MERERRSRRMRRLEMSRDESLIKRNGCEDKDGINRKVQGMKAEYTMQQRTAVVVVLRSEAAFVASPCLTLFSGDVWLVPELGGVLDKLDIHLNVWITICLDQRDKENDYCPNTNAPWASHLSAPHHIWTLRRLRVCVCQTGLACCHRWLASGSCCLSSLRPHWTCVSFLAAVGRWGRRASRAVGSHPDETQPRAHQECCGRRSHGAPLEGWGARQQPPFCGFAQSEGWRGRPPEEGVWPVRGWLAPGVSGGQGLVACWWPLCGGGCWGCRGQCGRP